MSFHVYMLTCSDGSFYVGHTDDLDARMAQHRSGEGSAWTRSRLPVELAWTESFPTRDEAFQCERQLKGWSRAKKNALVSGDTILLSILSHRGALRVASPIALRDAASSAAPQGERGERNSF